MGYDAYAYLMLGVEIDDEDLWETRRVPGCHHKHYSKFCPECGHQALIESRQEIEGWEEGDEEYRGLQIRHASCEGSRAVLGVELGCAKSGSNICHSKEWSVYYQYVREALVGTKFQGRDIRTYLILYESY